MNKSLNRMKELVETLNAASRAYYQEDRELMSNYTYDRLYDELTALERETGIVLAGSPTVSVGYEALDELPKERHEEPMLSLDKTKNVEDLAAFAGTHKVLVSWKLDGLTVVLTYRDGQLYKAVTRGNGEVGEVITNNARVFKNIPLTISFKGELILRGEAVITYKDFARINEELEDVDAKYKNPRNLCSGSVRQLNNEITAKRHVRFYAFSLVRAEGLDAGNSRKKQFDFLASQGFEVVEHQLADGETMAETVRSFAERIDQNEVPSDGLVLTYDDIAYGQSLGRTAKFPRDSYAFKWADEIRETTLTEVEWSASRTGLINPVAIFEPVELEGTTVSRASVHNVSIVKALGLGLGDQIQVYKANMIIPQIAENLTRSGNLEIPSACPVCGGKTEIKSVGDVETLYCTNPECQAKQIKSFTLFVSRDAINIDGLSEATLEKFIGHGLIRDFADIFHLEDYREQIVAMEGFGVKSFDNLMESIRQARKTTVPRLVYSLGIPGIGLATAKQIARDYGHDIEKIRHANAEELAMIDGIGAVTGQAVEDYFAEEKNQRELDRLLGELELEIPKESAAAGALEGKTFVITGKTLHFPNRNALKEEIEKHGGKVTGSVTSQTSYLINNDVTSSSTKNKKARELGIPILSEEDFLGMLGEQ